MNHPEIRIEPPRLYSHDIGADPSPPSQPIHHLSILAFAVGVVWDYGQSAFTGDRNVGTGEAIEEMAGIFTIEDLDVSSVKPFKADGDIFGWFHSADLAIGTGDLRNSNRDGARDMGNTPDNPQIGMMSGLSKPRHSESYYEEIKKKFAEERDLRLKYRPEGTQQYTSDLEGGFARYALDPFAEPVKPREPLNDTVECLFIGGGFSALLTSARLREAGVESIRIVERGADVGGTWYWNRYPGVACDVVAYDYLPMLDEMDYVPKDHYAKGPEIFAHCQAIARRYNL